MQKRKLSRNQAGTILLIVGCTFWGLMSAVGVATYSMTSRKLTARYGSIPVTTQGMLTAGIAFALISRQYRTRIQFDREMVFPLLGVVILGTVPAYTMYVAGVDRCGPFKASVPGTLELISAVVFSALWLKTDVTVYDILGGVMILSIVVIQNRPAKESAG